MKTQVNDSMPFAGLTVSQVKEMLEELLAKDVKFDLAIPEVIGIEDVAQITGYTIATIYSFTRKRIIPFYKHMQGRKLFFVTAEIYEWMKANRVETNDEFVRNHRKCKSRRDTKFTKTLKHYIRVAGRLKCLCDLLLWMCEERDLTIKILENQIAQNELQIKKLSQK